MQTMTWIRKWASSQLSKLGVVYLQVVDLIGVIFLSFFILPGALQRNTSCVFWTASLALPLQGFDTNALGLFCEHSVSRTLAPVQLSKLAGINLADDITGFRHSFIFISVLLLYGDGPNDKRGSMGNVRLHIFIRSVMFPSRDWIILFYVWLDNQIMWSSRVHLKKIG